ncbi:MAG: class B sortase [Christensenella sp.]|uniref:class B sortase n=1 Tax=Christensenella sp. TaxID=1935934 RepID=UPI002B212414|nr:class B sortase [Christensenella sp.]MEA5003542.1 class B sortase [Christensenella sp.]
MANKIGEEPEKNKQEMPETQESTPRKKRSGVISWVVIVIAAVVLVFSLVQYFDIKSEDWASEGAYDKLKEVAAASAQPEGASDDPRDRKIDFAALKAINEDVVGWIYMPNTKIDYPIVIGKDNDYYISHNVDKTEYRAGAIFLDYQNAPDFSDQNTIIYGHRMNDGSMFGTLNQYESDAFFRENDTVYVYLQDGSVNEYKIFSAYTVNEVDETYTMGFASDENYEQYLKKMRGRSPYKTDVELSAQDNIITLSTCVRGQDENRYVVQAVLEK